MFILFFLKCRLAYLFCFILRWVCFRITQGKSRERGTECCAGEGLRKMCACTRALSRPKLTSLGQTSPLSSRLITASLISALRCPWASQTENVQNEFLSFSPNLFSLQTSLTQLKSTFILLISQIKNSGIICGYAFSLTIQFVNKSVDSMNELYPESDYVSPAWVHLPPFNLPSLLISTTAVYSDDFSFPNRLKTLFWCSTFYQCNFSHSSYFFVLSEPLSVPGSQRFSPMCSSPSIVILAFLLRSVNHFKFIFAYSIM